MVRTLAAQVAAQVAEASGDAHRVRVVASLVAGAAVGIVGVEPLTERLRAYPDEDLAAEAVELVERVAAEHRDVEQALAWGPPRRRASAA